jgi:hypothetical protein
MNIVIVEVTATTFRAIATIVDTKPSAGERMSGTLWNPCWFGFEL